MSSDHLGSRIGCEDIQFLLEQFPLDSVVPKDIDPGGVSRPWYFLPIEGKFCWS